MNTFSKTPTKWPEYLRSISLYGDTPHPYLCVSQKGTHSKIELLTKERIRDFHKEKSGQDRTVKYSFTELLEESKAYDSYVNERMAKRIVFFLLKADYCSPHFEDTVSWLNQNLLNEIQEGQQMVDQVQRMYARCVQKYVTHPKNLFHRIKGIFWSLFSNHKKEMETLCKDFYQKKIILIDECILGAKQSSFFHNRLFKEALETLIESRRYIAQFKPLVLTLRQSAVIL